MTPLLIISDADVQALVGLDELRSAMAGAFITLSAGEGEAPARIAARAPLGLLGAMPGYAPGLGLAAKLVSVFPGNASRSRPSHCGVIVLFGEDDGVPTALIAAGVLTALRTAAASAVAVELLGAGDATSLAILGAGTQGAAHLGAIDRVRRLADIRVASRTAGRAALLCSAWPSARACESFEDAVRGADVVCCCTDARNPVIAADWVSPGALVISVGTGEELPPDLVARSQIFVEWRGAVTNPPPAGAVELQGLDASSVTELGELLLRGDADLAGPARPAGPARTAARHGGGTFVYKSTGHALEDVAAAALVVRLAREAGTGQLVEL